MLQKEDKEEPEIIKIVDLNPFKGKEEILTENILNSIDKKQNNIRLYTEILNEDEKRDKKRKSKVIKVSMELAKEETTKIQN
jgi:hypothetical protein